MGSSQSVQLDAEDSARLSAESSFSREELQRLYSRFISLDKAGDGALTPADLERIPELSINPVGGRLVASFFADQERMNFTEFVRLLSIFRRTDGNAKLETERRAHLLRFLFNFYDGDCDGVISVDDLQSVLRDLLGKDTEPQKVRRLAERTISSASGGSLITFSDFEQAMADHKDLLNITFLD